MTWLQHHDLAAPSRAASRHALWLYTGIPMFQTSQLAVRFPETRSTVNYGLAGSLVLCLFAPRHVLRHATPCLAPPHVLHHPMSCAMPPHVLHHPMSRTTPCPAPPDVLHQPTSCTTPCPAPPHVLHHPTSCTTPCPAVVERCVKFPALRLEEHVHHLRKHNAQ